MSGSVLFAMITRLKDGLPLSATTDHDPNRRVLESKKFAKILSRKAANFPDRCSMFTGSHWLYLISSLGVCFITMCEESYPSVLAFCFLDELQREFISSYDNRKVDGAVRPYALIDFDRIIQKTKQRYNNTMSLGARKKYSDMTLEVKLRPPHRISIEELEFTTKISVSSNGLHHRGSAWDSVDLQNVTQELPSPANFRRPFLRLDWMGRLLVFLSFLCGSLNLTRIVGVITFGTTAYDSEEQIIVVKALVTLFLATLLCYYQSCTMWRSVTSRAKRHILVCLLLVACNFYLYKFYWRFIITATFHVVVAVLVTAKMWRGSGYSKLANFAV